MELYSKRMGAVESSKHATQRMTHDPSLQVGRACSILQHLPSCLN